MSIKNPRKESDQIFRYRRRPSEELEWCGWGYKKDFFGPHSFQLSNCSVRFDASLESRPGGTMAAVTSLNFAREVEMIRGHHYGES